MRRGFNLLGSVSIRRRTRKITCYRIRPLAFVSLVSSACCSMRPNRNSFSTTSVSQPIAISRGDDEYSDSAHPPPFPQHHSHGGSHHQQQQQPTEFGPHQMGGAQPAAATASGASAGGGSSAPRYRWNPYSQDSPRSPTTPTPEAPPAGSRESSYTYSAPGSYTPFAHLIPGHSGSPTGPRTPSSGLAGGGGTSPQEIVQLIERLASARRDSDIAPTIASQNSEVVEALLQYFVLNPAVTLTLCEKSRGNVVAQTLEVVGPERGKDIASIVIAETPRMAFEKSGSVALVRVFEAALPAQQDVVVQFALPRIAELAVHPFANYVLQSILQTGRRDVIDAAIATLLDHHTLVTLTGNKFGSHVVEKFLVSCPTQGRAMREVMLGSILRNPATVGFMVSNRFANYVIQSCLKSVVLDEPTRQLFVAAIEPLLKTSPFAYNIVKAWTPPQTSAWQQQ